MNYREHRFQIYNQSILMELCSFAANWFQRNTLLSNIAGLFIFKFLLFNTISIYLIEQEHLAALC